VFVVVWIPTLQELSKIFGYTNNSNKHLCSKVLILTIVFLINSNSKRNRNQLELLWKINLKMKINFSKLLRHNFISTRLILWNQNQIIHYISVQQVCKAQLVSSRIQCKLIYLSIYWRIQLIHHRLIKLNQG